MAERRGQGDSAGASLAGRLRKVAAKRLALNDVCLGGSKERVQAERRLRPEVGR